MGEKPKLCDISERGYAIEVSGPGKFNELQMESAADSFKIQKPYKHFLHSRCESKLSFYMICRYRTSTISSICLQNCQEKGHFISILHGV